MKLSTYLTGDQIPVTVSLCTEVGTAVVTEESVATRIHDTGVVCLDVEPVQFDTREISTTVDRYGVYHVVGQLDHSLDLECVSNVTLSDIEVEIG